MKIKEKSLTRISDVNNNKHLFSKSSSNMPRIWVQERPVSLQIHSIEWFYLDCTSTHFRWLGHIHFIVYDRNRNFGRNFGQNRPKRFGRNFGQPAEIPKWPKMTFFAIFCEFSVFFFSKNEMKKWQKFAKLTFLGRFGVSAGWPKFRPKHFGRFSPKFRPKFRFRSYTRSHSKIQNLTKI